MALPGNAASSTAVPADYESPYDRYRTPLEDFEAGGVAISDGTQGLDVQIWHLSYNDDEASADYGDFTITGESTGEVYVALNVADVVRVGLAFNQNMDPFIAYETKACEAKFYWYDTFIADYTTTTLPGGSKYLACCLDDHRITQTGTSDIILAYIRNGTLYYRQERDRFTVERSLGSVGAAILHRVGMTKNLRLKFDVREGRGVRLSEIVGDLCAMVGVTGDQIDVSALYPIEVRGFISAGQYEVGDTIRALQQQYFFDLPLIDGKLVAVRRGGEVVATITLDDLVADREFRYESAREQGVEFPGKMHLAHATAETDYTPTTVTSERRSPDFDGSHSEDTVQSGVNHTTQDGMERLAILHKVAWTEYQGRATFSIPESFAQLVPSCPVNLEVRPGEYKRVRITRMVRVDGAFDCEAVRDRQSSYAAGSITLPVTVPGETPPPTIPGDTTWEFMDLPILDGVTDSLYYYVSGHGDAGTAWHGARLQREVGADWETEAEIPYAELMGQVEAELPAASAYSIDTTNELLVSLNGTPSSTTFDLMMQGRGAWLIGNEIVQVQTWAADGANWRGTTLLRGRLDTTPATHAIGTRAVYLGNPIQVPADAALVDTNLQLRAPSYGQQGSDATDAAYAFAGKSQEEWPPESLTATQDGSDWDLAWVPRYRLGNSANPIPSVHFYGWRLTFTVGGSSVSHDVTDTAPAYTWTAAQQTTDFGSAQSSFDVSIRALNYLGGEGKALTESVS